MTRPRKFEEGKVYHIVKRGVGDQKVFKDAQDYSRCSLSIEFCNNQQDVRLWDMVGREDGKSLAENVEQARQEKGDPLTKVLGFALMPTHMHLLVQEIIEGGTTQFMTKLGGYSTYFNERYDRGGSLFRRYESVPIETDEQLHITFAYVHTNPVSLWEPDWKQYRVQNKKKALEKLKQYPWSTYPAYIGKNRFLSSIDRDFFLNFFGSEEKCRQVVENWVDYKAAETTFDRQKFEQT